MAKTPTPEKLPAISIRQPWADMILWGIKNIEFRSKPTKIRGRVYIYASKGQSAVEEEEAYFNLGMLTEMYRSMDRGVIVGTAEIFDCVQAEGDDEEVWQWVLLNPDAFEQPLAVPAGVQPQPSIWYPFGKP